MAWFVEEQSKVTQQSILSSLTLANVARVEKESAVEAFLAEIKKYRDEILGKITRIGDYIKDNNDEQGANRLLMTVMRRKLRFQKFRNT